MSTQVQSKKENLPSSILYRDDTGSGFENVKQESLALPILKLLQNSSKESQKRNENYVQGAEPGMFLNTVTKKLYDGDKGINVIPCHYKLEYQEWAEFGTGSGKPEQIYPDTSDILSKTTKDGAKDKLPNGNYILTVNQHYVLIVNADGSVDPALINMSSSQGKVSKKWTSLQMSQVMTDAKGTFQPAMYAYMYNLSTVLNSGKGNQWYGFNVKLVGPVEDSKVYARAKDFNQSLNK